MAPPLLSPRTLPAAPGMGGGVPGLLPPLFAFQRHREPADTDDLDPG